jgi:hypothetical protein
MVTLDFTLFLPRLALVTLGALHPSLPLTTTISPRMGCMGGASFCLLCRLSPGCSPLPLFLSRPLPRSGRSSSIYPPGCHPSTGALTASNPSHPHLSGSGLPIKATLSSTCPLPALPSVPPLLSLPLVARYREQRRQVHTPGIHSSSLHQLGLSSIPLSLHPGPVTRPAPFFHPGPLKCPLFHTLLP